MLMMEETFYTIQEVAEKLRASERSLVLLIRAGRLKAFKVGKEYRVRDSDFRRFVEQEIQRTTQQPQEEN